MEDRRHPLNHHWLRLDVLGLHRRKREAIRGLGEGVHQLEHLVAMLDQLAVGVFADDEADDLRGAATMMQAAVKSIMETSVEVSRRLGEIRFMAALDAITVEDPDEDEADNDARPRWTPPVPEPASGDGRRRPESE